MKFHFNKNQVINLFNSRSHLIEEYFYWKRQFFLHFIYFYNQYNSDLKIGKAEHENKKLRLAEDTKNIIVPDYIEFKNNFLIEYKKGRINDGAILQTYLYLKRFHEASNHTIINTGFIKSIEKHRSIKITYPSDYYENQLNTIISEIVKIRTIPSKLLELKYCKHCSFFNYCWCDHENNISDKSRDVI